MGLSVIALNLGCILYFHLQGTLSFPLNLCLN